MRNEARPTPVDSVEPYGRLVLMALPRAISLQDANPRSRTYGCCDRNYWHYKTITSFPSGTMQQLALPFAILYATPLEGNSYHTDPAMLERVRAVIQFWMRAQHRNGALDEWYRNEQSYCATAFTTFGISEAVLTLGDALDREFLTRVSTSLERAAQWLGKRFNPHVMNQNLAACAALRNVHELTGAEDVDRDFREKWRRTIEHRDEEGWLNEYGGADPGYGTLALDLLAAMDRRGCDANVREIATKQAAFLASLCCAGGGLAERLGSRGTAHAFPFGAAHFAPFDAHAARLASHLHREYENGALSTPADVDDRYLAYFYLPQFALACTVTGEPKPIDGGADRERIKRWDRSGFVIRRGGDESSFGVVCSIRRQGAFNLYRPGRPVHTNMGYWAETSGGDRWSSSFWREGMPDCEMDDDRCVVRGSFTRLNDSLPLVRGAVPFTIITHWLLRVPMLANLMQRQIKKRGILRRTAAPLDIERRVQWRNRELVVTDTLTCLEGCPALLAISPVGDIDVHSPSGRMVGRQPIDVPRIAEEDARDWARQLCRQRVLRIEMRYPMNENADCDWPSIRRLDPAESS